MSSSVVGAPAPPRSREGVAGATIPWHIPAVLVAATSVVVGVIWDISWHRSIGRDTFLTPAHLAIYLGGILAGTACGWLVLRTTFAGTPDERAAGVRFWGFRGPLGAWVCIWGAIAMITSAPFDNWWHNAYGLDVKVLSPPHVVLALGFTGIQVGALLLLAARQNTATADHPHARLYRLLFVYAAGLLVANLAILGFEYIAFPNDAHNATYYKICAGAFPILLVAAARTSTLRWPATTAAAAYMAVNLLMLWILQLFPATPKLAPIYNPLDHFVPPPFPILLVVPAMAIDLVLRRWPASDWARAALAGIGFVLVLLAVQWFAAEFLVSPSSEHFAFGEQRWNYNSRLGPWRHQFWRIRTDPLTVAGVVTAAAIGVASARLGLWWGAWMARVRR
ncbi:MAG: hypothetical protein ACREMF_01445 [Gemmatimonadales bacterium]